MTKDEALKMAIDGLEIHQQDIIDACKEALAEQPTQEPMIVKQDNGIVLKLGYDDLPNGTPFYTHPKQWQGLSDDEVTDIRKIASDKYAMEFARAIEAKLREKNG